MIYANNYENETHIGKRSAAGYYCWDCGVTLCADGEDRVHYNSNWLDACPKCGKTKSDEGWESAVGRELGFAKNKPAAKTGVASCCSFSWAIEPDALRTWMRDAQAICPECTRPHENPDHIIKDEYGRLFTPAEFEEILEECPIQYTTMIGREFS